MSSMLSSQGMVLATAMAAVSGTIILLAFRSQKPLPPPTHFSKVNGISLESQDLPRSCISSDGKKKSKSKKKKKSVHFAEDVTDPTGNSEEYRKKVRSQQLSSSVSDEKVDSDGGSGLCKKSRRTHGAMPANRVALYNGILSERHRVASSF